MSHFHTSRKYKSRREWAVVKKETVEVSASSGSGYFARWDIIPYFCLFVSCKLIIQMDTCICYTAVNLNAFHHIPQAYSMTISRRRIPEYYIRSFRDHTYSIGDYIYEKNIMIPRLYPQWHISPKLAPIISYVMIGKNKFTRSYCSKTRDHTFQFRVQSFGCDHVHYANISCSIREDFIFLYFILLYQHCIWHSYNPKIARFIYSQKWQH